MDRRGIIGAVAAVFSTAGCAGLWASLSPVLPPGTQLLASYAGTGMVTLGAGTWMWLYLSAGRASKAADQRRERLMAFIIEAEALQAEWNSFPNDQGTEDLLSRTEAWGGRVASYLEARSKTDRDLFVSDSGFTAVQFASQYPLKTKAGNWLVRRKFQLDRLLQARS